MTFARDLANFADISANNLTFRNSIINGDFGIWQRGTSFTNTANAGYTADRWLTNVGTGGTIVTSQQSFTPGTAPVSGYEAPFFCRVNRSTTGTGTSYFVQRIEDVRTFAGQTITLSFWAKASSAYTFDAGDVYAWRVYGTGGSTSESPGNFGAFSLTTSWQRFTAVFNMPSVVGKTIGANSYLEIAFSFPTSKGTFTIDLWGVQLEAGSSASPFEFKPYDVELAQCQRYYQIIRGLGSAGARTSTDIEGNISFLSTMRTTPSASLSAAFQAYDLYGNGYTQSSAAISIGVVGFHTDHSAAIGLQNFSGLNQGRVMWAANGGNIRLSAEL